MSLDTLFDVGLCTMLAALVFLALVVAWSLTFEDTDKDDDSPPRVVRVAIAVFVLGAAAFLSAFVLEGVRS